MAAARFTIELPLGRTAGSSVFLARGEWPWRRLLRLKQWAEPAPLTFVPQVDQLRVRLEAFAHPAIVLPLTAWLEPAGTPAALTDFRQGIPLLEAVRDRRLPGAAALASLRELRQVVVSAHEAGLFHGSIGPGNVLTSTSGTAFILDFGFKPAFSTGSPDVAWRAADLSGFDALESQILG